jgi:uncharacterized membrane protein YfcA
LLITDLWFYALAIPAFLLTGISKGGFWAGCAGFTSFLAHAGGPPAAVYLNYLKLVPYFFLGALSVQNLLTSLASGWASGCRAA